ncbi:AAA domain-containing protein [Paenibacillus kribbensis]|uniref:AAA domain-containing protein n=1 Tax=Paenibacillus kribbensis TaxID=172713 RepID=UPI002DB654C9|nr:AAA domain-containing protein [Paenibacillus kribbensis]MEC0235001.1 AAA domain-containing protein [Paenibacillus kribbensis]
MIDISEQEVFIEEMPLDDVKQVILFDKKAKIWLTWGKPRIVDSDQLTLHYRALNNDNSIRILQYWTEISEHTKIDNGNDSESESRSFLNKQMVGLNAFIHPQSALSCYMNQTTLTQNVPQTNHMIFPFKFNLSQKQALIHALSSNISVIEGPPGTGKTQTILNIIANLAIMQNKTVAVVSGNNAAVQNVKDKLEKLEYDFFVASLGNADNQKAFFEHMPRYAKPEEWKSEQYVPELMDRIKVLDEQIHKLMELQNEQAQLKQQLSAYQLEQQHYEHYYKNQNIKEINPGLLYQLYRKFYQESPQSILSFLAHHHVATAQGKLNSWLYKAKAAFQFGYTDFVSLREYQNDVLLNLQKEFYAAKIKYIEQKIETIQKVMDKATFSELLREHEQLSTTVFKHQLHSKYDARQSVNFEHRTFKSKYKEFIQHFPVVLSTTHSLRNCAPQNFLFDYVIIDESSQVDLLTGVLALSCGKNAIIVGDTKQLPHIVDLRIKDKLGKNDVAHHFDYFQHNILSSMLALYGDALPKVMLREHYRCHPQIIGFCNAQYYDDGLIPFTTHEENVEPLILFRTVKGNHMREVTRGEKLGKYNQRELDVVEEVLRHPFVIVKDKKEIGFATPYRKQVIKAGQVLPEEIESDTIHKYQGREKTLMILSTVLDQSVQGKKGIRFVDDPCKINVAVSRAQQQFVLVTGQNVFTKANSEVGNLIRYMEYSTLNENIITSEIVSIFDLLYKEYSEVLIGLRDKKIKISRHESENIANAFLQELLEKEEYRILSIQREVYLKNFLNETDLLDENELKYVKNNASLDFVLYHKLDKRPQLVIEVDGFAHHENKPEQLERDRKKDSILTKYKVPFLRLKTEASGEEERVKDILDSVLGYK